MRQVSDGRPPAPLGIDVTSVDADGRRARERELLGLVLRQHLALDDVGLDAALLHHLTEQRASLGVRRALAPEQEVDPHASRLGDWPVAGGAPALRRRPGSGRSRLSRRRAARRRSRRTALCSREPPRPRSRRHSARSRDSRPSRRSRFRWGSSRSRRARPDPTSASRSTGGARTPGSSAWRSRSLLVKTCASRRSPSGVRRRMAMRPSSLERSRATRPISSARLTSSVTVLCASCSRSASSVTVDCSLPSGAPLIISSSR